jgi:lipoprotein NlpD
MRCRYRLGPESGGPGALQKGAGRFACVVGMVAVVLVALLAGCASQTPAPVFGWSENAPAPAGYYRVRRGDTLSEVAEHLKLDFSVLAGWNHLAPPYPIVSGGLLRITPPTDSEQAASATAAQSSGANESAPADGRVAGGAVPAGRGKAAGTPSAAAAELHWQWPLRGPVLQTFVRGDRLRSGIRIGGRPGARVVAAEAGEVVYSGSGLKGYGNLIIVKHNKNYLSAYGFNRRLLVAEGTWVKRGQPVAEVGQKGGAWLLHFEIRRRGTAVNPLAYLPKVR